MTTKAAAAHYERQHVAEMHGKPFAVFNPHNKPVVELPVIYGWNNGGHEGWYSACLIAEDGTGMGGHICSSDGYIPHDLGLLEGTRPDRHEKFQEHYPDGYRMQLVPRDEVMTHPGLSAAYELNQAKPVDAE
jgi:hypothetical protein